jgi:hypothetical protein
MAEEITKNGLITRLGEPMAKSLNIHNRLADSKGVDKGVINTPDKQKIQHQNNNLDSNKEKSD